MTKLVLNDLDNLDNPISVVSTINSNNAAIKAALENTLSRNGASPNTMTANLDLDSYRIINLPEATSNTEPIRKGDASSLILSVLAEHPENYRGPAGPQGPIGLQGSPGPAGPQGPQGATGLQGAQGPAGATGPQGPQGNTGATGLQGLKGDKGDKGDTGATGPQGPGITIKGSVATVGNLPSSGNVISDAYIVTADGHLYVWGGSSWTDVGQFKGDKGDTGATGATGPAGSTTAAGCSFDPSGNTYLLGTNLQTAVKQADTALGTIASSKQNSDPMLSALSALTTSNNQMIYFTGSDTPVLATITAFGRSLIDDADNTAARSTLGLGTAAVVNTGASSGNVPVLDSVGLPALNGSQLTGLTKAQVSLGNVDNTSDVNKPISTATQNALNLKADITRSTNIQTGSTYTFQLSDSGKIVILTNATGCVITIPLDSSVAFPTFSQIVVLPVADPSV